MAMDMVVFESVSRRRIGLYGRTVADEQNQDHFGAYFGNVFAAGRRVAGVRSVRVYREVCARRRNDSDHRFRRVACARRDGRREDRLVASRDVRYGGSQRGIDGGDILRIRVCVDLPSALEKSIIIFYGIKRRKFLRRLIQRLVR